MVVEMSFATVNHSENVDAPQEEPVPSNEELGKFKYKSYKKKFLKMRHTFKDKMRDNGRLYEAEQHSRRIARRLQEQNDQLLDLLLGINTSTKVPAHLRFDLRSPTPNQSEVPALEPDIAPPESREAEGARAALVEARLELEAGQISLSEYKETESSLLRIISTSQPSNHLKSIADLSQVSHTKLSSVPVSGMPSDLVDESPIGYLSPNHEDEYLLALDNQIENTPPDSLQLPSRHLKSSEKEREKDAQINNPVSVYNWLRAHSETKPIPHDLEKDMILLNAHNLEQSAQKRKPSPKPPSSTSNGTTKSTRKRASSALIPKQEPEEELLDEDGNVISGGNEVPTTYRGKRKRENDDAYRPKGGSSKSRKRTKGSGGAAVKRLEPEVEEEEEEM